METPKRVLRTQETYSKSDATHQTARILIKTKPNPKSARTNLQITRPERVNQSEQTTYNMYTSSPTASMKTIRTQMMALATAMLLTISSAVSAQDSPTLQREIPAADNQPKMNIHNYTATYNSGKVFVSWTSKNETADCLYIIERSKDGYGFESVGIKEGIGSEIELYYSWIDKNPPAGFAYYRVKKITRDGTQMYSAVNAVINQSTNFENYALEPEGQK
jgi:hypothetical protein